MRKEYDFSRAKRAAEVPHLNRLRAQKGKTRISIMLDDEVIAGYRLRAEKAGIGYQTEINRTLREALAAKPALTADSLRRILRQELRGK